MISRRNNFIQLSALGNYGFCVSGRMKEYVMSKENFMAVVLRHSRTWLILLPCLGLLTTASLTYGQSSEASDKYLKRGVSRLVKNDYDNAISDFDSALALKPDFGLAYFYRGKAREAKRDLDGAIDDFERAFRADSRIVKVAADVADLYRTRGLLRLEQLDLNQAISDFDRAISLKPNQAENFYQRGTALLIDGDYSAAISDFNRCIELDSKYARAYLARGVAHMHRNNHREAKTDFDKCLELRQEADLMLQMYILELETKIKQRRAHRESQRGRIA